MLDTLVPGDFSGICGCFSRNHTRAAARPGDRLPSGLGLPDTQGCSHSCFCEALLGCPWAQGRVEAGAGASDDLACSGLWEAARPAPAEKLRFRELVRFPFSGLVSQLPFLFAISSSPGTFIPLIFGPCSAWCLANCIPPPELVSPRPLLPAFHTSVIQGTGMQGSQCRPPGRRGT